jgi:hypothetical protein
MLASSTETGIEVDGQALQPAGVNDYFAWPDSPRERTSDADAIGARGEQHAIAAVRGGSDVSTILARTAERHEDTGSRPHARHPGHADGGCGDAQDESPQTARQRRAACPARRNGENARDDGDNAQELVSASYPGSVARKLGKPTLRPASPLNARVSFCYGVM